MVAQDCPDTKTPSRPHAILFVEDAPFDFIFFKNQVRALYPGLGILTAMTLTEAKHNIRKYRPDLIVLDLVTMERFHPDAIEALVKAAAGIPLVIVTDTHHIPTIPLRDQGRCQYVLLQWQVMDEKLQEVLQQFLPAPNPAPI